MTYKTQPEALRLAAQLENTEGARLHLLPYAAAELRRLHAEAESLRTDAERYRWLRDKADSITVCGYTSDREWIPLHPKNIDSTIDAAMEADHD
jgi:hypothetical protein